MMNDGDIPCEDTDRDNRISNAILVKKKELLKYIRAFGLNSEDDIQQIYEEFAGNLNDIDVNKHDILLENRIFLNMVHIYELQELIGQYEKQDRDLMKEEEIISLLSLWMPDVLFSRIIPIRNQENQEQRIMLECTSLCKDLRIKFYMKLTIYKLNAIDDILHRSEKDYFNDVSSYSSRFLSMKYQKVLSEHIILTASSAGIPKYLQRGISTKGDLTHSSNYFLDVVLSDYCEYSLREIVYPPKLSQQYLAQQEIIRAKKVSLVSNYGSCSTIPTLPNAPHQHQTALIEKFSFQHLQKDLVESLFFMHTIGYTHNGLSLDTVFYDKYINAFVIGGFEKTKTKVQTYDSFRDDIRQIGLILLEFLVVLYNLRIQEDLFTMDDLTIRELVTNLQMNKLIQSKKNFILLNLNIYQQRNILLDIFSIQTHSKVRIKESHTIENGQSEGHLEYDDISHISDRTFDIVELAIALNIQNCLVSSSQSRMKNFLTQNNVFDERELDDHLIDPLNNSMSYWKYKGSTKNGLFDGIGEIFFQPPSQVQFFDGCLKFGPSKDNEEISSEKELNNNEQLIDESLLTIQNESVNSKQLDFERNISASPDVVNQKSKKNVIFNIPNNISHSSQSNEDPKLRFKDSIFQVSTSKGLSGHNLSRQNTNEISLGNHKPQNIRVFKGIWESGFNQKYLTFVSIDQFKDCYMLSNHMKIIQHNSHQELSFSVKSDRPSNASAASKIIDLQFSYEKEHIIDSLNILMKYLQIPIARITFDFKGAHQRKVTNEAQSIELQIDDGSIIYILFDSNYVIKEEEFYIILEKATLSTYLVLDMIHTQISDKFFYGMSFNTRLQYLSHLQITHTNKITDEGFLYFVRNCPSKHLVSLNISHTQLSNISLMELTQSNRITKLIQLNISNNPQITEGAITEFVKSSNSFFISHLNVSALDISDNFIEILCLSPFMKNISEIIMNDCPKITFKIFEIFTKSESVNYIKRIELSNCLKFSTTTAAKKTGFINGLLDKRKSKQEFKQFAKTDKLGNLHVLNLQGCQIVHNHIKQLAASQSMKLLEELNLSNCEHVNDECIKEISISQNFTNLRILLLSNLKALTHSSIEQIGNSKYLTNLDQIHFDGCEKIDSKQLANALNLANFQNLKIFKFDEMQYSIQILRLINFSNKNSIQTFWRLQSIDIVIINSDLFFKQNISEILSFNQKPIKFIVNKAQESSVIQKLAIILYHQINMQETNCKINVNNVVLNDRMLEEIKRQKAFNTNSYCGADIFVGNFKQIQRNVTTDSFKKEYNQQDQSIAFIDNADQKPISSNKNITQSQLQFSDQKVYCKNECFKAMHYLSFVKELTKLDLSFSKQINLPGYQFIKECIFFPNLIELNLQSLAIQNKHLQQLCTGIIFSSLRILNLKNCSFLTFQGFEYFIASGIQDTLQYLDISKSSIEGTDFSLCLPDFIHLSQLNSGNVEIIMQNQLDRIFSLYFQLICIILQKRNKNDIKDEEKVKRKMAPLFQKVKSLFYINQLSFQITKLKITSQVLIGIASILMDHYNTLTSLQIVFCGAKKLNSEQSVNLWSSIAQLAKLKSLSLVFQSCKDIDKMFLKNLFFGISVLTQLEEVHLAFPKSLIEINQEDFTPLCVAMTRLQKLQILDINFHEMPVIHNQFMEEFVYIVGKLESIKNLSVDYSWILNFSSSNIVKLFESLESSKMKLYTFTLDLEMCSFTPVIWKKIKKYILSQTLLRELNLNIAYCLELKEKSVIKFINQCLELKMLKTLTLQLWGQASLLSNYIKTLLICLLLMNRVSKLSSKSRELLKQNTNLYMIDNFDLSIQEAM